MHFDNRPYHYQEWLSTTIILHENHERNSIYAHPVFSIAHTEKNKGAPMNASNISQLLADRYSLKILAATYHRPRSTQELSLILDIPIASSYRRVKELEKEGLLKVVGRPLTREGKRYKIYQSQVNNITLVFEKGKLRARRSLAWQEPEEVIEPIISTPKRVENVILH